MSFRITSGSKAMLRSIAVFVIICMALSGCRNKTIADAPKSTDGSAYMETAEASGTTSFAEKEGDTSSTESNAEAEGNTTKEATADYPSNAESSASVGSGPATTTPVTGENNSVGLGIELPDHNWD